jgi:pilus assembly protein Flp/PilA
VNVAGTQVPTGASRGHSGDDTVRELITRCRQRRREEAGATAVEYGIMVALIAIVIIGAVAFLGTNLTESLDCAATTVGGLPNVDPCAQ